MSVCVTLVRVVRGDAPVVPIKIMQDGGCVQGVVGVPLGGVWWLVPPSAGHTSWRKHIPGA